MGDPEPFNSSDIEFSPVQKRYANAGAASIASMRDRLFEDRISSKKRVRGLTDVRGAPGTQYGRGLWLNRFENHVKATTMQIDPQTGPDIVTILRFVDTIVKHIRGRGVDDATPLRSCIRKGIQSLFSGLTFEYPKFNLTRHECTKLDALIDTLASEKKLLRGKRRAKNEWIGVALVENMSRCWLQAALDCGCLSWDVVIHRAMTVVLQSALCCRAGEISKSCGYTVEFMRWSHLVMTLPPGQNTLDDVHLTCQVNYMKGKKGEMNDDWDVPLRTLRDPALNVVCPVKLLLIQALRSGNISSLDDALTQASLRRDRTVQWLHPDRPVLPQLRKCSAFIAWDVAAGAGQVNKSTKDLALVSGVLANVISHDLRRGAFRDLANAKPSSHDSIGVATREVARVAGHAATSYLKGTTDKYVGEVEKDTYTARAEQMFVSRKTPAIGSPYKKRRLTKSEIDNHCKENNIDPADKNGRQRAGEAMHRQRKTDWIESEKSKPWTPSISSRTSVSTPTTASSNATTTPASAPVMTPTSTISSATTAPDTPIDPRLLLLDGVGATPASTASSATTASASPNDQHLLLLDGVDVVIEDSTAQRLESLVYGSGEDLGGDEEAMGLDIVLGNADSSSGTSILTLPGREFVEALSKINIVRCQQLERHTSTLDELFPVHCPMGNARDYPSLFTYSCAMCQDYSTRSRDNLRVHQHSCKGKDAKDKQEKLYICDREGCGSAFSDSSTLQGHMDGVHSWDPTTCTIPGCTDDRVFSTRVTLNNHITQRHHPIEPAMHCSFPGCKSSTLWSQRHNYKEHLKLRHHLVSAALQKPYLPQNESSQKVSTSRFQSTECPIGGSPACKKIFKRPQDLTRHLTRWTHGLSTEEAKKITRGGEIGQGVQGSVDGEDGYSAEGA
ncbi:uncharacterized protein BP5553_08531 [Venustampulla echinocandica]|uniref:C2H2-type domain-containing protein n=1 Tax=Venustampulla echinocandica TaxID=2656787 RepID=A0A370TEH1_9HELO|nr:uncharacterized protein BP5553_08531 [Venustampulla echinocandica]RDL33092.1 hypothetical protein BP5553_08531 [Venustampulla echinocandica]